MLGLALSVAGAAGVALGARQFSVATDAPHVIVGAGVIVAALACFHAAVAALRGKSDAHDLLLTGVLVLCVAIATWVVRVIHAAATGLIVTYELDVDAAYVAVACCGVGMILVGAGVDELEGRHRNVPTAVLSVCGGVGAIVLCVVAALTGF